MTKQIERQLAKYPIYSQEKKGDEAVAVCKFFSPVGSYTWYVTEGEKQENGDWTFFGLVENDYGREYGYFTLKEFWRIGFVMSWLHVAIVLVVGPAWWFILGLW